MTLSDALAVAGPRGKVRLPGRYAVAAADLPSLELTDAARLSPEWEACPAPPEPGPWTPAATDPPEPGLYLVCRHEDQSGYRWLAMDYWNSAEGWPDGRFDRVTHWTPLPPMPDATA